MEMSVRKHTFCDFVLWTAEDTFVGRIFLENFSSTMLEKCALYFQEVLLPEFCFGCCNKTAQGAQAQRDAVMQCEAFEDELYCYCAKPEHGDVVHCDGKQCERKWFHFACVGLKRPPSLENGFVKNLGNKACSEFD